MPIEEFLDRSDVVLAQQDRLRDYLGNVAAAGEAARKLFPLRGDQLLRSFEGVKTRQN